MRKLLAKILVFLIILKIISPIVFIGQVFAVSNIFDFNNSDNYIVSDEDKINIHNSQAKLKSTLSHVGNLDNGPTLLGQAYQIEVSGNYAYITSYGDNALQIVDISDPANPIHMSSIKMNNTNKLYGPQGIEISGDYVFIASYVDDDIEIIDVSDKSNPVHVKNLANSSSSMLNGPRGLDIDGNYLYVASYTDDALQIVDISDPTNPVAKGYLKDSDKLDGATDVKIKGNYAYVTSYSSDNLEVIDISDPDNPSFVGELLDNTGDTRLNGAWGIEIKGNYVYVGSYVDDTLEIIDISDPINPVHLSNVKNSDAGALLNGPRFIRIDGDYIYVSAFVDDGIQVIDISDPANPVIKGYLMDNTKLDGASDVFIVGDNAFVAVNDGGRLEVLDISDKDNISFKGELLGGEVRLGGGTNTIVDGNYAYVSSYLNHSIEIIDISDKANPKHISAISASNDIHLRGVYNLKKKGDYLYTANYIDDSIAIIDISDPANPNQVSYIKRSSTIKLNGAMGIDVDGNYAYIASYVDDAVQIIDISDPANPVAKGYIQDDKLGSIRNLVVHGNYAYVTSYGQDRLIVVDISDKDNPSIVLDIEDDGSLELDGTWGIIFDGNYIFISGYIDDGVQIFDISDPANPIAKGNITNTTPIKLNGAIHSTIDEGYLYQTARNDDAVQILDVSDKDNIVPINYYIDSLHFNGASGISKQGNYIFVSTYFWGSFEILKENYFSDSPYVSLKNSYDYVGDISSINVSFGQYNSGSVSYQISKDDGNSWYYYDGNSWQETSAGVSESSNLNDINDNIDDFNTLSGGTDKFNFKAFLNSNGDQKVELEALTLKTEDLTAPVISGMNVASGSIIPGGDIIINYSDEDGGSGINTASGNVILEKWDSGNSVWEDVSNEIGTGTLSETGAIYSTLDLDFGKYKISFDISDNNANKSDTFESIFYKDKPSLVISTGSVNIGELNYNSNTFGDTLTVTVKTIGAPFRVKLKKNQALTQQNSGDIIPYYDGTLGMGYDKNNDSNLSDFNDDIILSDSGTLNTDGELNTYTYDLKIGAIIDKLQVAGNYEGKIDFGIELDY